LQSIQVDNFRFQIQVQAQERPIASQAKNTFGYLMQTEASKNKSRAPAGYNKKSKAAKDLIKEIFRGEDLDILNEGHSIESLEVNLKTIPNVKFKITVIDNPITQVIFEMPEKNNAIERVSQNFLKAAPTASIATSTSSNIYSS
jgi:hypothetical protein